MTSSPKVVIAAGELSGDQHGAKVVEALYALVPGIECKGMGGRNLRAAGMETVVDSERVGGVMGFSDVFFKLKDIRKALSEMKTLLAEWRPSVLVLIDYPDFNMRLARYAKDLGIKVLYFIPPKVWAWRSGRAKTLGLVTDIIAAIFPFEKKFYASYGVAGVQYVGHPFANDLAMKGEPSFSRETFCRENGLDQASPIVLLMPGSRKGEISQHLQTMIDGLMQARLARNDIQGVIGVAPTVNPDEFFREVSGIPWIRVVRANSYDLMKICDAGVLKSGTCNLEAAYIGLPFVCVYQTKLLTTLVAKAFVKLKEVSLPNIISSGTIRELLLEDFTPKEVAKELLSLLVPQEAKVVKERMKQVRDALQSSDSDPRFDGALSAPERVARLVFSMMSEATV